MYRWVLECALSIAVMWSGDPQACWTLWKESTLLMWCNMKEPGGGDLKAREITDICHHPWVQVKYIFCNECWCSAGTGSPTVRQTTTPCLACSVKPARNTSLEKYLRFEEIFSICRGSFNEWSINRMEVDEWMDSLYCSHCLKSTLNQNEPSFF